MANEVRKVQLGGGVVAHVAPGTVDVYMDGIWLGSADEHGGLAMAHDGKEARRIVDSCAGLAKESGR